MKYFSTRDHEKKSFDSAYVIKHGLADDGGLFIPDSGPLPKRRSGAFAKRPIRSVPLSFCRNI